MFELTADGKRLALAERYVQRLCSQAAVLELLWDKTGGLSIQVGHVYMKLLDL